MDYNLELEKKISYLEGQLEEKTRTLELLKDLYLKKNASEELAIPYTVTHPYPWSKYPNSSPYTVSTSQDIKATNCSPYWLEGVSKTTV